MSDEEAAENYIEENKSNGFPSEQEWKRLIEIKAFLAGCKYKATTFRELYGPAGLKTVSQIAEEMITMRSALNIAVDTMEWIMPKVHQGNHEGDFVECGKATCIAYREAASEIFKRVKIHG